MLVALLSLLLSPSAHANPDRGKAFEARSVTLELPASGRHDDALPIRVSWPEGASEAPVIVWSHGLGGSRDKYETLVRHWVEHGFVVLQPSHQDRERMKDPGDFAVRPGHVSRLLDQLEWIVDHVDGLDAGEVDADKVGIGGHSAGAHTTMLAGGMTLYPPKGEPAQFTEPRADALLLISPQGTGPGHTAQSFSTIAPPVLMITGSKDASKLRGEGPEWRMEAWEHLPADHAWLLYIDGADHGMGGINQRPGKEKSREMVSWIQEATLQHWRAQLQDDRTAASWMDGDAIGGTSRGDAHLQRKSTEN